MFKRFLFPIPATGYINSIGLLVLRVVFGGLMMTHGWGKLTNFAATAEGFEQMGMMGGVGAGLAIFAEFFCAMGVIVGLLYRLALIPLVVTMSVAFFMVHGAAISGEHSGEMPLLYLATFVALFIMGPGKYAVDTWIGQQYKQ